MPSIPVVQPRTQTRGYRILREVVETVLLTAVIFFGVRLGIQNFRVEGQSMEPNFHSGEYILVDRADYLLHSPHRGDVIVFRAVPALSPDHDFIKRVIGLPGERVSVRGGAVYIDGRRLHEPYIRERAAYTFAEARVPVGDYFVLGDHRNNSYDSAHWTSTPWLSRKYIIGKAWIAYWPLSELSFVSSPSLR
jgi:signal peptidase I